MTARSGIKGGVAAGHQETVSAAIAVLQAGGNAFDAAIAGFLAACVAEPVLSSLGGGGFLVARTADNNISVFDFFTETPLRRPSPDAVDFHPVVADFGPACQEFHIGLGAAATPGAVAGVFAVHGALGRIPLAEIAAPAIELARRGLSVDPFQAYLLKVVAPIYSATALARQQFCRATAEEGEGKVMIAGDHYATPNFADFLYALVREGPELFYQGDVAGRICAMDGCAFGRDDLARYQVERRAALDSNIAGHRVFLNPPPSIGGALIDFNLRQLDAYPFTAETFGSPQHVDALVSSMAVCNQARIESNIDFDPLQGAAALQGLEGHPPAYRGTTHISVVDADGNMAALTSSNGEGCGHIVPGTGVMLNNMLGEDDLNAQGFFNWREGVRLSSMMSPGVLVSPNGTWLAFGSGGSNRIRSALTQLIVNLCIFGQPVEAAVSSPRLHLEGQKLSLEPGLDAAMQTQFEIERWPARNMFFGGTHVVSMSSDGVISGAGDPRRDGVFRLA